MMNLTMATVTLLLAAFATAARATVTVGISPATGNSATVTLVSTGLYDVALTCNNNTNVTTFTVTGATTDSIRNLELNGSGGAQGVLLNVYGPTSGQSLTNVASIDMNSTPAQLVLVSLRASGDVGSIEVHSITSALIGDDVTGNITLPQFGAGGVSGVNALEIGDDLLGSIQVDASYILNVIVGGDIGSPGTPVNILARDGIGQIIAQSIYADINAQHNGGSGSLFRLEATVGDFAGEL